jgi:hypothetical protein
MNSITYAQFPAREIKHAKEIQAEYYQRKEDEKNG